MMNRGLRCFALVALMWVAVAPQAMAQATAQVTAQAMTLDIEGKYEVLQPPQQTETGDRIEVVDVFWYGCPHCYVFLPVMEAYEQVKPDYVEIRRLPAVFRENWAAHARAFYTASLLGVLDRTHRPLFEEIHEQRNPTDHREALAAFFERQGVDRSAFEQTWDSFAVESLVRKSVLMQQRYGITGTPSVVVNGKYRVTGRLAGSYDNMIAVVMALVERERKAQPGASN
ncbi:MAG: thiol:disulfide interchange protein DsbA/DsbL [Thiotrichales bacterium]|nr:thiol:disulfide interchange protein DsbA/DsbL [Thiotrichales bacterium]